jgi:5-aminolevulinate synthase
MLNYFKQKIETLKLENRYREFVDISRICGEFPYAINNRNGKKIIVWCSNDYLGMGQNQLAINAAIKAIKSYGVGSGGTRNISGTNKNLVELEKEIASLHGKESALVFVSGYVANDASIQALVKIIPDLIIFSDEKNHASIICGISNSNAKKHIFRHNDLEHLEELLKNYDLTQPKLIIFESVYSMDGDFGKIKEICAIAKKYNAMTYIDEVHGVGVYGAQGGGLCEEFAVANKVDLIQGTFAKGFGAIGGYISGKSEVIDAIRLTAAGFIFTTAIAPATAAASLANIKYLRTNSSERKKLHDNVIKLKTALELAKINIVKNNSHIISIKIGDAKKAQKISQNLLNEFNIYVQHINYPTVAKSDERLRITITSIHNDKMIEDLVAALVRNLF